MDTTLNHVSNTASKVADKAAKKSFASVGEVATIAKDTLKKGTDGITDLAESFDFDEITSQLKSYATAAFDFAKKRPVLVISAACAIGLIGAWALSSGANKAKDLKSA